MKKYFYFLCTLFLASIATANAQNSYDIKDFNGVAISESINAKITLSDTFSVELSGQEEALNDLVVELRGKTLLIRPKINWKSWQKTYPEAHVVALISMPKIENLVASGSGSIQVEGLNQSDQLTTTLSGSAKVNLNSENKKLITVISGKGEVQIIGKATSATITISGSGSFKGEKYQIDQLTAIITGGGKIYTHTEKSIDATINGAGKVYYLGEPVIKGRKFMGSGAILPYEDSKEAKKDQAI